MTAEQLTHEIKAINKALKRAQQRVDARESALRDLREKWVVVTAKEHGVVIGQKRYIKPMDRVGIVKEFYYSDGSYPELDIRRVFVLFDYSSVDPVNLAVVLRDSDVVDETKEDNQNDA